MPKTKKVSKKKKKQILRKPSDKRKLDCLRAGDLIEIIAPGSHTLPENLEKGVKVLRSWGYRVSFDENLLRPELFLSDTDENRFKSFSKAMNNPESKAVWCLRGGYGSIRLLPMIEKMQVPKIKKLLIGLSDICSLHVLLNQKWNFPTLHGPLLDRLALNILSPENIYEVRQVLENPNYVTAFENLVPINKAAKKTKTVKARIVGGNLMVVTSTLGTSTQLKTADRILFLEELAERSYRIDRCLQQMMQAGLFKKVKAVVFGDFTNCDEPNKDNHVAQVLESFFRTLNIPAFKGVQSGHDKIQRPVFFNTEAHLTCGEDARMLVYSAFKEHRVI